MNTRTLAKFFGAIAALGALSIFGGCGGGSATADAPPTTPSIAPPTAAITAQPADQSVVAGTTATFTVTATGASAYQ